MPTLSIEDANQLVIEHQGWAESVARSVARSWNLDWKLNGLDGAAMEALIFCARRFDPDRGVPFRGYARRRIHEASSEAARKCKGWRKGGTSQADLQAREISAELMNVFPELRTGELPYVDDSDGGDGTRAAIRQLLVGASLIAAKQSSEGPLQDELLDYKRLLQTVAELEPVHQSLIWKVYWEGHSMRSVATEWETDELNVIREHQVLLSHLQRDTNSKKVVAKPKVRPGLRPVAMKLKRKLLSGPFSEAINKLGGQNAKETR